MIQNIQKPRQALNKAFLKVKPSRSSIEQFKENMIKLLDQINEAESEEFHKNIVIKFLQDTYYNPDHYINTKGRNDLVIHNGKKAKDTVGVIVEAKKPTNRTEMLRKENINTKAFQEMVLYYLRERFTANNLELKYLVATNIYEWFIFDANIFEKAFAENKALVKQFNDFEAGRLSGKTTDFFYKQIAEPIIEAAKAEITFTWLDIRDYEKPIRNNNRQDDTKLIALYKLLSPEHLLKLPFANDSNSLDKGFYTELLHIIGLVETKQGGKKLIERKKEGERNNASIIENTIIQLDSLDKILRLDKPSQYGGGYQERLFNVALELSITWINRILFLKLLEAQLISYSKGDQSYAFLNIGKINDFDDLNSLFFSVLAKKPTDRHQNVEKLFAKVPYLNSSLFEPTALEQDTVFISNMRNGWMLPLLSSTVIKDNNGKKRKGELDTLTYLFEFLAAYDFSSEGSEDIQEENKTLINASVLGLIFEKINGYKDGSFFTPGFITMYMCRETIRRAVLQKFNDVINVRNSNPTTTPEVGIEPIEKYKSLLDVFNAIETDFTKQEANNIINSLKICDPAVGSGHFLVSALNEIIVIKRELNVLLDRQGRTLRDYDIEVVNDELIITDDDGHLFEYNPNGKESQRIQETFFHEKQTIIENCLFGVDINSNSVKICRLRLWIELLKNAYYRQDPSGFENLTGLRELETLPNIDINIKCGNSLISRFALDADLRQALKKSKWSIDSYRIAVDTYRNAQNKEQKREMERLIFDIKSDFRTEINKNEPKVVRLSKLGGELYNLVNQQQMFGLSKTEQKVRKQKQEKLEVVINKLKAEIEEIKSNKVFENAFEWRFEFPEVLNDNGDFVGFDVVIGNPPYIRQEEITWMKQYLELNYSTFTGTADLYVYFVELGLNLLKSSGAFIYILPNKWMRAGYGSALRSKLKDVALHQIIDFGDLPVFEEATTYPCILHFSASNPQTVFEAVQVDTLDYPNGMNGYIDSEKYEVIQSSLGKSGWTLIDNQSQKLMEKIRSAGVPLSEYVEGKIYRGVLTGLNEAFVINENTKQQLIREDPLSAEIIKPFLAGRDIKRYQQPNSNKYLIFTRRGIEIEKYPAILNHLEKFKDRLVPKHKDWKGKNWSGRKPGSYKWYEIQDAVDYYEQFKQVKILWPGITDNITSFAFDEQQFFGNDNNQLIISPSKYLLAILNSSVSNFLLRNICDFVRGGFVRLKIAYVSQIPIPSATDEQYTSISNIVAQILKTRKANQKANTTSLEKEIDQLVYGLYGLSEEEIGIIENAKNIY